MPLIATRGAASAQGFGEFAQSAAPVYIEDVFSTYLYTGTGSSQTITNNIDLSGKGGLVWIRQRDFAGENNSVYDTLRGAQKELITNSTSGQNTGTTLLSAFNSNGFTVSTNDTVNANNKKYVSWTFREQPKFFDIVTYTGNGNAAGQTISHNLGSIPGFIICKCTSTTQDWAVCARTGGASSPASDITYATGLSLNTSAAAGYTGTLGNFPTSTTFNTAGLFTSPGAYPNLNGQTYVAYLFAHDAGGFGLTGSDNVISCGSFTTNGSGAATVTLGYEPQWLMVKVSSTSDDWNMGDNMRGMPNGGVAQTALKWVKANTADAESTVSTNYWYPTATGFTVPDAGYNNATFIYIAIRRGPMKTPTSGTSVFAPNAYAGGTAGISFNLGFVPDALLTMRRNTSNFDILQSRLTGQNYLFTNTTDSELGGQAGIPSWNANTGTTTLTTATAVTGWNGSGSTYGNEAFSRAPGFFDVVCYTGTGSATTVSHNLGVAPELMIVKSRNGTSPAKFWVAWANPIGINNALYLNYDLEAQSVGALTFNSTLPTSSVFSLGIWTYVNNASENYVAYLFASCPGVSKVGTYTGTGALQTVNCGFTGGARFVLIKRTDSTGDWWVYDSARGITSGNDPYLLLNSAAAEVTGTNYVDTTSVGFQVTAAAPAGLNANGGSYIFLAIA